MKKFLLITVWIILPAILFSQYEAYKIYNSRAKEVKFDKVLKDIAGADIILFGESHDDPLAHWLQLQLLKDLPEIAEGQVVAGAEMFESDNQLIINEYLAGFIDDKRFEESARLWNNYSTDYKPLLVEAKNSGLSFIATNIPRRYANMVSKNGFEILNDLSDEAREYIAPLPIPYDPEVPAYKNMMKMSMGHGNVSENFPKAQAVKDATMAHFILDNFEKGLHFVHFNGSYHSDHYDGIVWYLNQYKDDLIIKTLTTVRQENIDKLEDENNEKADYIIVVPEDMIRSY